MRTDAAASDSKVSAAAGLKVPSVIGPCEACQRLARSGSAFGHCWGGGCFGRGLTMALAVPLQAMLPMRTETLKQSCAEVRFSRCFEWPLPGPHTASCS